MAETKTNKIEREYTIPLRDKCRPVPRYRKTPKSVKTIKEFLVRHMKIRDKDLKKIKIDSYLNEQLWIRGIKKPLHKVKVKAVMEGDIVRVYSAALPEKIEFKKKRLERKENEQKELVEKQKSMMQKAKETMSNKKEDKKDENNDGIEDKVENKEKDTTSKLADQEENKAAHKEEKQTTKQDTPEKKESAKAKNTAKR